MQRHNFKRIINHCYKFDLIIDYVYNGVKTEIMLLRDNRSTEINNVALVLSAKQISEFIAKKTLSEFS